MIRETPLYRALHRLYARLFVPSYRADLRRRALARSLYARFVRPGDLCFDVGAHTGDRTDLLLAIGARVVAFEPQVECARILSEKFGTDRRFTLVQQAVGAAPGTTELFIGRLTNVSSVSREWIAGARAIPELARAAWDDHVTVPVTTLDLAIARCGVPAFCKIDVEGAELDVLRGLSQPVAAVSFEYTPWRIEPAVECVARLSELGRYHFNHSSGETMTLALDDFVDAAGMIDILRTKLASPDFGYGDVYAVRR